MTAAVRRARTAVSGPRSALALSGLLAGTAVRTGVDTPAAD